MSNILTPQRIAYEIDNLIISKEPPKRGNAPVTRASWTCENLPPGLTLSESGEISGRPTTAGSYECTVKLETNWGTSEKTIKITVS